MKLDRKGNVLSITGIVALDEPRVSSTGKSLIVATQSEKMILNGELVTVQVNVFKKAQ
jgi:hypothetical protein